MTSTYRGSKLARFVRAFLHESVDIGRVSISPWCIQLWLCKTRPVCERPFFIEAAWTSPIGWGSPYKHGDGTPGAMWAWFFHIRLPSDDVWPIDYGIHVLGFSLAIYRHCDNSK